MLVYTLADKLADVEVKTLPKIKVKQRVDTLRN